MKVFLTGGTGFIGAPLAKALVGRGWQVTVLTRSGTSPDPALPPSGVAGVKGDVDAGGDVRRGCGDSQRRVV